MRSQTNLILSIFAIICSFTLSTAQTLEENIPLKKNIIYVDATSPLVATLSINYERHLKSINSEKIHFKLKAGYGGISVFLNGQGSGGFLALSALLGGPEHFIEISGGNFIGSFREFDGRGTYETSVLPLVNIGYRYQHPERYMLRLYIGTVSLGASMGLAF